MCKHHRERWFYQWQTSFDYGNSLVDNHKPLVRHAIFAPFRSFFRCLRIVEHIFFLKRNIAMVALSACQILPLAIKNTHNLLYVHLCYILVIIMLCETNTGTLFGYYSVFLLLLLTSFLFHQLAFKSIGNFQNERSSGKILTRKLNVNETWLCVCVTQMSTLHKSCKRESTSTWICMNLKIDRNDTKELSHCYRQRRRQQHCAHQLGEKWVKRIRFDSMFIILVSLSFLCAFLRWERSSKPIHWVAITIA